MCALVKGFRALLALDSLALNNDASEYNSVAYMMTHLFDTSTWEPVWIWYVKLTQIFIGEGPHASRLSGIILFMLNSTLMATLATLWTKKWQLGLLAGLAYIYRPSNSYFAVEFMRDNLALSFSLLFMILICTKAKTEVTKNWVIAILTLAYAGMVGTRITTAAPFLLLVAWVIWQHRIKLWKAAIPIGTAGLIMAGNMSHGYQKYDDPMIAANWRLKSTAMAEGHGGCEVCTVVQVPIEELTSREWLFGQRSFGKLVEGVSLGYWMIYTNIPWSNPYYQAVFLFGFAMMLLLGYWQVFIISGIMLNLLPLVLNFATSHRVVIQQEAVYAMSIAFAFVPFLWLASFLSKAKPRNPYSQAILAKLHRTTTATLPRTTVPWLRFLNLEKN